MIAFPARPKRWIRATLPASLALACLVMHQAWNSSGAVRPADAPDPKALVGKWKVDLRPKPDAEPYFKEFVVKEIEGKSFSGTFYGTDFEAGQINADWGVVYFAFVTKDASGAYNHSGCLKDGKLEGLSHSLGRNFLGVWKATRAE